MAWLTVSEEQDRRSDTTLSPEQLRKRRNRSIAIGLALLVLVVAMVAITLVKGPSSFVRPI